MNNHWFMKECYFNISSNDNMKNLSAFATHREMISFSDKVHS